MLSFYYSPLSLKSKFQINPYLPKTHALPALVYEKSAMNVKGTSKYKDFIFLDFPANCKWILMQLNLPEAVSRKLCNGVYNIFVGYIIFEIFTKMKTKWHLANHIHDKGSINNSNMCWSVCLTIKVKYCVHDAA